MHGTSVKLIAIVFVCLAGLTSGAIADERARIEVLPDREAGPVNRLILGNNMLAYQAGTWRAARPDYSDRGAGIWDPQRQRPEPAFVRLAREAGISVSRWPGGCGSHNYNWKRTVGPLEKRPHQKFGLPEFLAFCEATDSIPILTIAVYWGTAADAADLVEYLNAPNDGSNPNGGTDWAAMRAADGHPDPYGVVWFEYGNESNHGEHSPTEGRKEKRKLSAEEYARRYLEYRAAMKAVDPRIKLGAILWHPFEPWNRTVLRIAGRQIDFGIEHTYVPGFHRDTTHEQSRLLMQACTAVGVRLQQIYDELNQLVKEETGRADLPWAVTEYNGHFVQSKPVPYRQSLGNALRNAEHIRVMMRPQNRIAMANFWQFANEYWGMVRGYPHKGEPLVKQANFYVYQLYNEHFGDVLIESKVECGHWEFPGGANVPARRGKPSRFWLFDRNLLPDDYRWRIAKTAEVKQHIEGNALLAEFSGRNTNYYHASVVLPARPLTGYRVTGEIKTEGLQAAKQGAGFQVGDARGWTTTHSASLGGNVRGDSDWTQVVVDYVTLPDTKEIQIVARRLAAERAGDDPVSGRAHYRLLKVQEFQPDNDGAVPDLSVNAAKRADGTVTLMIVNTNLDRDVATTIAIRGRRPGDRSRAAAWSLVGSTPWATNVGKQPGVRLVETPIRPTAGGWQLTLRRHSLTALEIEP